MFGPWLLTALPQIINPPQSPLSLVVDDLADVNITGLVCVPLIPIQPPRSTTIRDIVTGKQIGRAHV